jgi:hypothetical protein
MHPQIVYFPFCYIYQGNKNRRSHRADACIVCGRSRCESRAWRSRLFLLLYISNEEPKRCATFRPSKRPLCVCSFVLKTMFVCVEWRVLFFYGDGRTLRRVQLLFHIGVSFSAWSRDRATADRSCLEAGHTHRPGGKTWCGQIAHAGSQHGRALRRVAGNKEDSSFTGSPRRSAAARHSQCSRRQTTTTGRCLCA